MSSEKKKRKVSKKLHWGRGRGYLKCKNIFEHGKGSLFFNSSQRQKLKKIDLNLIK